VVVALGLVWYTNLFGWRHWRLQEAEAFIGSPLPAAAAEVQFATQNTVARIIWLRFDLPPKTDLTPFLTALGASESLTPAYTPFPNPNPQEAAYPWWQPFTATTYAGLHLNVDLRIIEILVDQTPADHHTVYLRAYNTRRPTHLPPPPNTPRR